MFQICIHHKNETPFVDMQKTYAYRESDVVTELGYYNSE
jgi:hypothetical protein